MSEIADIFSELFYGSGSWLGLLLLLALMIAISLKNRYAGLLMIPVAVFLGISYLSYPALMWNALIMFIASVFLLYQVISQK